MTHVRVAGAALASLLVASGCATTRPQARVDDAQIAGLPDEAMREVTEQQGAVEEARRDAAATRDAEREADIRLRLARTEVEMADARRRQAEIEEEMARSRGESPPAGRLEEARRQWEAARAKENYLARLKEVAESEREVAERHVALAEARLERAKYSAVVRERPQAARELDLRGPEFERVVAQRQGDVADARARLAERRSRAIDAYDAWLALERDASEPGRRAVGAPAPAGRPTP